MCVYVLVANIVLFRVQGCEEGLEIRAGGIYKLDTPKVFRRPGTAYPRRHETLSVDCLFLRSPSQVPYRTELSFSQKEFLISFCRISIQSTIVPVSTFLFPFLKRK